MFSPSRIPPSHKRTQNQGNAAIIRRSRKFSKFTADFGRDASRDVVHPKPSSIR